MNQNKTILIVDDNETNIDILVSLLDQHDILVATDGYSAIDIASKENIDLILLDIMMPNIDGYEVCSKLKQNETTKSIPIIFITAKIDENSIEKAYDTGGADYITKPFKPKELLSRVKLQLQLSTLIENLEFLASKDTMTGIYNRRKFFELAQKSYDNYQELFAVMLDIDNFKSINDLYGHSIGDKVIKEVANTISSYLNDNEIFGRIGGEEFAIISEQIDTVAFKNKIEEIRQGIESIVVLTEENQKINVTISIGVTKKDNKTKSLDSLLQIADNFLYEAKNSGRNKVIFRT